MSLNVQYLLTNHIDLWTSAIENKSSAGRGSSRKQTLYGIKKLRELILELAVRGKLVSQDPNDEPASELLKRIEAERDQLVKEGKIKKPKKLPEISDEEKPFKLPVGWAWYKIGNYLNFEYGKALPAKERDDSGRYDVYGSNGPVGKHSCFIHEKPCIIIGRKGSAGALNKCLTPSWTTDVAYFLTPPAGVQLDFLYISLQTMRLEDLGKGIKPGVNRNEAYQLVTALPPLAEQHRIVAKVDELMALCDQLEQQTEQQLDAHQQLVDTLLDTLTQSQNADELADNWTRLSEYFDTLFTTEASIDQLKQTILQLAVMGKLVPQNPNDEPASELLKRIAAEKTQLIKDGKIKKQKPLPPISEEEKPFELPEGWEWCRLNNAIDVRDGTHDSPKEALSGKTYPLVTSKDFDDGKINFENAKQISEEDHIEISKRSLVEVNDILFSMIGGNIGNQVIVSDPRPFSIKNVALFKYYDRQSTTPFFFQIYTKNLATTLHSEASGGAQPFISLGKLRNLLFALPPVCEQNRIVNKTNELLTLCDHLKELLTHSQQTQLQLTDTLVTEALNG
ncbi:restriction endonuclease subunit S [Neptunomonas phycophila]|uniref:Restriction endonuclease subunit S n=1 Tax=Neptunomonas phycophila TaxID=1572645 RepID=A0AAW7XKR5_9GAMM|nr:restriction endonuclease subunit S [Neptunomonas phycophila]MDO6453859.1 restriction endonuclease subunit S [Neptunomonas phycophila]